MLPCNQFLPNCKMGGQLVSKSYDNNKQVTELDSCAEQLHHNYTTHVEIIIFLFDKCPLGNCSFDCIT